MRRKEAGDQEEPRNGTSVYRSRLTRLACQNGVQAGYLKCLVQPFSLLRVIISVAASVRTLSLDMENPVQ